MIGGELPQLGLLTNLKQCRLMTPSGYTQLPSLFDCPTRPFQVIHRLIITRSNHLIAIKSSSDRIMS